MFWILQISEDEEQEQVDEQERQVEFEKESQQLRRKITEAEKLEKDVQEKHKQHNAKNVNITVGTFKFGEFMAWGLRQSLGRLPLIGLFILTPAFAVAEYMIKAVRIPLELTARSSIKFKEKIASKKAKQLRKETRTKPSAEPAHGDEGVRLPILNSFRSDNKPKEVLGGLLRFSPQLYRFLFIMGIGLIVMGAILIIAASIAALCEPSARAWLARKATGMLIGSSINCDF